MDYGINDEPRRIRNQVQHFIRIGRYEKAKIISSELISKYPEYPYAYYDMAVCEYYLERIDNSIELCYKALELGMRPVSVSIMLMLYYNEKGDFINVDRQHDLLKTLDPNNNDALAFYGYSLWKRGKHKEGITMLEEAFANDAMNPHIIGFLFAATKKSRDNKQKEQLLNIYMSSSASEKKKLIFAGKYYIHMKKWKEAKRCFSGAIGIDPMNSEALDYMKIIELKDNLPKLMVVAIGWTTAVYFLRFDNHQILTYGYFIPSILMVSLVLAVIYKLRRL